MEGPRILIAYYLQIVKVCHPDFSRFSFIVRCSFERLLYKLVSTTAVTSQRDTIPSF